jgi:hypothetical protein
MRGKAPVDDIVRRRTTRRDPREERESIPPEEPRRPSGRPDPREEPEWDAEERDPRRSSSAPPPERASSPDEGELAAREEPAPISSSPRPVSPPDAGNRPSERPMLEGHGLGATSIPPSAISIAPGAGDVRLLEIEPLLARSDWKGILARLGPPEKAGELPATLGLIYALAQREDAGDLSATPANVLAIRCMAALYGVAADSATALVLAKRLLRQNPASWRTAPAPSAKYTIIVIVIAIVLGTMAGSYLSLGSFRF